jgi:2-phosphosulfolactate phosphatase
MSAGKLKLSVCISPSLAENYPSTGCLVVVVDILRATSCWVTAFAHGAAAIRPVNAIDECKQLMKLGYIGAAERQGVKVEGFDLGNSPFEYQENINGKKIAVTTTNGTRTINTFKNHKEVIIGSFLNFSSVVKHIRLTDKNVILACAGWEGGLSLEDILFTGAVIERFGDHFELDDAAFMALSLWVSSQSDFRNWLNHSSHVQRLLKLEYEKDVDYCFTYDLINIVPRLAGDEIINPGRSI